MKEKPSDYKESYFCIYNFNGIQILYYNVQNIHNFEYKLKQYINNNSYSNYKLYIIYHFDKEIEFEFIKEKPIYLIYTKINYELFFYLHKLRHDYFYKNNLNHLLSNKEILLDIYDKINVTKENFKDNKQCHMYNRLQWIIPNYKNSLQINKQIIEIIDYLDTTNELQEYIKENKPIEKINYYNNLLEEIKYFLENNIFSFSNIMDFKEFAECYTFNKHEHLFIIGINSKNIVLENVYYINKCWFDKDKKPFNPDNFYNDFEYREHNIYYENNKKVYEIDSISVFQEIKEEVMFLDYLYGFYNFGEFWDVIKRLLVSEKKGLPLFHLSNNRITNIEYYFDKLSFKFPTNYQKQENNNKLYYFHKVNISTVVGYSRGYIDKYFAYHFNKLLNEEKNINDNNYHIYLARGSYGRSIKNEKEIVELLKCKYNFIVLDGSETFEKTRHYFTNAKIILGAHGSLMKNVIWSKKNPIFIELCPYTRHDCFGNNSQECGFTTFFFVVNCDEKEQIELSHEQTKGLFELLDNLS
jgi:hypothetical protein